MAAFSPYAILSLLILESLAMVFPLGFAQLTPPEADAPIFGHGGKPPVKFNLIQCMAAMTTIFSCAPDSFGFLFGSRSTISQACCIALFEITEKCSTMPYPVGALAPQDYVKLCAEPGEAPTPVSSVASVQRPV